MGKKEVVVSLKQEPVANCDQFPKVLKLDIEKHNKQYPSIHVNVLPNSNYFDSLGLGLVVTFSSNFPFK